MVLGLGLAAPLPSTKARDSEKSCICIKCPANGIVLLNNKDTYCKACFLFYVNHKFRSTIARNKIIARDERVVIAFSGGGASLALATLVKQGVNVEQSQKRLQFRPLFLHIVEDERLLPRTLSLLRRLRSGGQFPVYCVPLTAVYDSAIDANSLIDISKLQDKDGNALLEHYRTFTPKYDQLRQLLLQSKSVSSVSDFREKLRLKLLWYVAAKLLQVSKVMLADSATKLATCVLSFTAMGRGPQIPMDTQVIDNRFRGVSFLRPMKAVTSKELALYNHYVGETPIEAESNADVLVNNSTVTSLTSAFLKYLQPQFPATENAIVSTASKLVSPSLCTNSAMLNECQLCASQYSPSANAEIEELFGAQSLETKAVEMTTGPGPLSGNDPLKFLTKFCLPCKNSLSQISSSNVEIPQFVYAKLNECK